jgi:hypothetical protein
VAGDWKTLRHVLAPAAVVVYCPHAVVPVHPRTDRLSRQDRELALSFAAAKQLEIWLVYALDLVEIFLRFLCKSHVYSKDFRGERAKDYDVSGWTAS